MLCYIKQTQNKTEIYQTHQVYYLNKSPVSIIKEMCIAHLFTYEGYLKACRIMFDVQQLVPIYLSIDLMMIPSGRIRDYETIFINDAAIIDARPIGKETEITFINHHQCIIKMSYRKYIRAKNVLMKIRNTKVKHFHLQ